MRTRSQKFIKRLKNFLSNRFAPATWCLYAGDQTDNPLVAFYLYGARPHIVDVSMDKCRAWGPIALPCRSDSGNPFVDTVAMVHRGKLNGYEDSPLRAYYESWAPDTMADLLGLQTTSGDDRLNRLSPAHYVFPWEGVDPESRHARRMVTIRSENRQHGLTMDSDGGHPHWGPVAYAKGDVEYRRLIGVYQSIQETGFWYRDPKGGTIGASAVLVRDGDWRVLIRKGNHRIAVLAAIGWTSVPIRFGDRQPSIIHRELVDVWPNVTSGLFTRVQALELFDRLFDGRPPFPLDHAGFFRYS